MTLVELQDVLSKSITEVMDTTATAEEHATSLTTAEVVARLAKQMINNADVILRTDKLTNRHDRIDKVTG
jgi:hypothetical protein